MLIRHAFLAAAMGLAAVQAQAQSTYSIPNPLIKPNTAPAISKTGADARPGPSTQAGNGDSSVPVVPPLPRELAPLPGQSGSSGAPSNETIIRETLATFTVTAIVGNKAVLRNNAGYQPTGGAQDSASGNGSRSAAAGPAQPQATQLRQAVIRVKSDTPVIVAGTSLTPTVLESRVEFRVTGRTPVVYTVMLESLSTHGYTPQQSLRESVDPAVAERVAPNPSTLLQSSGVTGGAGPNGSMSGQNNPR